MQTMSEFKRSLGEDKISCTGLRGVRETLQIIPLRTSDAQNGGAIRNARFDLGILLNKTCILPL